MIFSKRDDVVRAYEFFGRDLAYPKEKNFTLDDCYAYFLNPGIDNYIFPKKTFAGEAPLSLDEAFMGSLVRHESVQTFYDLVRTIAFEKNVFLPMAFGSVKGGGVVVGDFSRFHSLLINGMTRYGKTTLVYQLLIGLLLSCDPEYLNVVALDEAKSDFAIFENIVSFFSPHSKDQSGVAAGLDALAEEVVRRQEKLKRLKVRNVEEANFVAYKTRNMEYLMPYIVVVSDEFFEGGGRKDLVDKASFLLSKGGASGLKFILSLQYSSSEKMTTNLRQSVQYRACFNVENEVVEKVNLGYTGYGTVGLPRGEYNFRYGNNVLRVSTLNVDFKVIKAVLKNIKKQRGWNFSLQGTI